MKRTIAYGSRRPTLFLKRREAVWYAYYVSTVSRPIRVVTDLCVRLSTTIGSYSMIMIAYAILMTITSLRRTVRDIFAINI